MSTYPDRPTGALEDRGSGDLLPKDIHFDASRTCEDCGARGAYDLHGAYLCKACAEEALEGLKSPGQSRTRGKD